MLMLLQLKRLLRGLILPPTGFLLLAILGLILLKRRPRLARACLTVSIAALWLLSMPVISNALVHCAERYPPFALASASASGAQAIVILGGGGQRALAPEYNAPAADPVLLERLTYGAYLAKQTQLPVLITGFQIEAAAMRATLERNFDVTPRWVDGNSFDTFQNARNSVALLGAQGIHRILLVTHATHMWRALHEFTAAGIEVVPAPMGINVAEDPGIGRYIPTADGLLRSNIAIYELLGEQVRSFLAATQLRRH
jgi:uncharacterized SAM-binding protein YcdF (DUF218 family)